MERLIREVTDKYVSLLPDDVDFYTPELLEELDIPDFIVERVVLEMNQNLSDSVVPPYSEWADMSQKSVKDAWQQFIDAIVAEVRMPVSFAKSIFETAVADVLDILIKPRLSIPSIIYGADDTLNKKQLTQRLRYITVNKHLSKGIFRFMERRDKEELSLGDCKDIIEKLDIRLTKDYTALNWAQILDPLFNLLGPSVDTNTLRLYFEDKAKSNIARRLDLTDGSVNRTELIEILSSPDLLDVESYDDPQSMLFSSDEEDISDQTEIKKEQPGPIFDFTEMENLRNKFKRLDEEDEEEAGEAVDQVSENIQDEENNETEDDSILNFFHKNRKEFTPPEDAEPAIENNEESGDIELYKRFNTAQKEGDEENDMDNKPDVSTKSNSKPTPQAEDEDTEEDEMLERSLPEDRINNWESDEVDIELYNETDEDEEVSIWRSFLERDDVTDDNAKNKDNADASKHKSKPYDDPYLEDSDEDVLIDLTNKKSDKAAEKLENYLVDEKTRYLNELFDGSEMAYVEAIQKVSEFDDWKRASRYIEKEIFSKNLIDVYDEIAVDFTDRLHAYFLEFKTDK